MDALTIGQPRGFGAAQNRFLSLVYKEISRTFNQAVLSQSGRDVGGFFKSGKLQLFDRFSVKVKLF